MSLPNRAERCGDERCDAGFTMIELLVTMLLLTVVLLGTAALQITTVRQVTGGQRVSQATRLAEARVDHYRTMIFSNLPAPLNPPAWEVETNRYGESMRDVGVDAENKTSSGTEGGGPFIVERLIENPDSSGRRLITIRVQWIETAPGMQADGTAEYRSRNVTLTLQRSP